MFGMESAFSRRSDSINSCIKLSERTKSIQTKHKWKHQRQLLLLRTKSDLPACTSFCQLCLSLQYSSAFWLRNSCLAFSPAPDGYTSSRCNHSEALSVSSAPSALYTAQRRGLSQSASFSNSVSLSGTFGEEGDLMWSRIWNRKCSFIEFLHLLNYILFLKSEMFPEENNFMFKSF